MVEKLEQSRATVYTEYCQNRGQKKPAGKNPSREQNTAGNLGKTQAHALKSPSYEGYTAGRSLPLFTKHVIIILGNANKLRNPCETRTVTSKSNIY